jgi:hypothetical protein
LKLIDISENFSVNSDHIVAVERAESGNAQVYIEIDSFRKSIESNMSFETMKFMLKNQSVSKGER